MKHCWDSQVVSCAKQAGLGCVLHHKLTDHITQIQATVHWIARSRQRARGSKSPAISSGSSSLTGDLNEVLSSFRSARQHQHRCQHRQGVSCYVCSKTSLFQYLTAAVQEHDDALAGAPGSIINSQRAPGGVHLRVPVPEGGRLHGCWQRDHLQAPVDHPLTAALPRRGRQHRLLLPLEQCACRSVVGAMGSPWVGEHMPCML